jgi:hypothetical protein
MLGRVVKTTYLLRYLHDADLRDRVHLLAHAPWPACIIPAVMANDHDAELRLALAEGILAAEDRA